MAFDARTAGDEEAGKIDDFGFAGGVLKDGFAIGQRGGHEQVFRAADGGKVEMDVRAVELAAAAEDVPVLKIEPCPHLFEGGQVQIHGAGPDGAAAGHGYAGFAEPGQQRARARAPRRAWF